MPHPPPNDTICAIATPPGHGGLGVVRLSGPLARDILAQLWRGRVPPSDFEPRRMYLGEIIDATTTPHPDPLPPGEREKSIPSPILARRSFSGGRGEGRVRGGLPISDPVLAVFMPAPATYTGDDVVEISAHGSPVILRRIVDACIAHGARLAEPGEFTRRAFLAGKLDLAQAEGVCDLIAATGERAARIAADQLSGKLSREVGVIADSIVEIRAHIEALIDFPEEGIERLEGEAIIDRLAANVAKVGALTATFHEGRLLRDGVRTAIVGRPNAGKSSLFNLLVGAERAIVHADPGTTRDVVEEAVSLDGVVFRLRDTAGMRSANCEVEGLGVSRSRDEIAAADLVVAVFDGSIPFGPEDEEVLRAIDPKRAIPVINKVDLPRRFDPSLTHPSPLRGRFVSRIPIFVSAKTGAGLDRLRAVLVSGISAGTGYGEGVYITSSRHRAALGETAAALSEARRALESRDPPECIAHHLRAAQDSLGKITGSVTDDEVLGRIFSRFCIGK